MSTALAIQEGQQSWDQQQLAALRQLGLTDAGAGDLALFLHYSQKTGLDPFSRQIYMIGRWDSRSGGNRYTIQSSIDGLRVVAQRSGEYAGQTAPQWCGEDGVWKDVWLSDQLPSASRIGVYRQGFAEALYAVATLKSYMPTGKDGKPQGLWSKMADVMLAKVAEALALRKAFPNDLSGIYTSEEMDQADARPVAPATVAIQAQAEPTAESQPDTDALFAIAKAIANVKTKTELRDLWKANADQIDIDWTNSLGEEVTLRSLFMTRQSELPTEEQTF